MKLNTLLVLVSVFTLLLFLVGCVQKELSSTAVATEDKYLSSEEAEIAAGLNDLDDLDVLSEDNVTEDDLDENIVE